MSNVGASQLQVIPESVTVQPGSIPTAPVSTLIPIADVWVYSMEIMVPDGPGNSMGFNITYAGTQILPWSQTPSFLVVNDWDHSFDINSEWSSNFTVKAYNTGAWPHTIYMRLITTPIGAFQASQPQAPVNTISADTINAQ